MPASQSLGFLCGSSLFTRKGACTKLFGGIGRGASFENVDNVDSFAKKRE